MRGNDAITTGKDARRATRVRRRQVEVVT